MGRAPWLFGGGGITLTPAPVSEYGAGSLPRTGEGVRGFTAEGAEIAESKEESLGKLAVPVFSSNSIHSEV